VPSRILDYPIFDADNHMYETPDALTKHLEDPYKEVIKYIDISGRTKITVKGQISEYIPNPTFNVVAAPGAQEEYFKNGNPDGKSRREILGKAIRSPEAFFEPEPRVKLMDELGIDRAMMWPTLASLVEERLRDDPFATAAVIKALNRWMYEQWSFNYEDRIFATPVITLPIVDRALEELQWCLDRGAKTVLVRPAAVPSNRGSRSFGLEEFDPFWQACVAADVPVSMHASDSGYAEQINAWEPTSEYLPFTPTAFRTAMVGKRPIEDAMFALTCHGALSRNPDLRILSIENGASWVPHFIEILNDVYTKMPQEFAEHPVEAFKRGVYVAPFWEDDFAHIAELIGVDRVIFGSDWPHPEGLKDPLSLVDELQGLSEDGIEKVMGANMLSLLKIPQPARA
jgi:predicted TIM-barrel fold metal-dependent hydrolase